MRASATPHSVPAAFLSGAVAGGAFLVVELAVRVAAGVATLPELVQDRLVQALPGAAFSFLLDRLLYLGKPLFFGGLLLLQLVVAGLVGVVLARWHRPVVVLTVLWLAVGLGLVPLA